MRKYLLKYFVSVVFSALFFQASIMAQCGLTFNMVTQPVPCFGDCNGQASISGGCVPTGGSGNYSYLWNDPVPAQTTCFATGLCGGAYNLTVTDITAGCDTVITIIINEPTQVVANITSIPACNGECNGIAVLQAGGGGGGVGSPYTYKWINLSIPDTTTGFVDSTSTFTGLCPGNYAVTITDPLGCNASTSGTVGEATALIPVMNPVTDATCANDCDGQASASVSGSQPPYTFSWSNGQIDVNTSTSSATGLCAGNGTVIISDTLGCDTVLAFTITEPQPITLQNIVQQDPVCKGVCDGSVSFAPSGGTGSYSYNWTNTSSTTNSANSLCSGTTYSVTITDQAGCDTNASFVLTDLTSLTTTSASSVICAEEGIGTATATVTPVNGTTPYTYFWSNGQTSPTATGLSIGETYSVTVTDGNGCNVTENVFVEPQPCPIKVPDTFSPNGDEINDTWKIKNLSLYSNCEVKVYNRWGDIVFSSTGYDKEWDGKSLGISLPAAVYYYVITVKEINETFAGSVTILK